MVAAYLGTGKIEHILSQSPYRTYILLEGEDSPLICTYWSLPFIAGVKAGDTIEYTGDQQVANPNPGIPPRDRFLSWCRKVVE